MSTDHTTILPDGWKSTVICTFDQLESIRPVWQKMQVEESYPAINADIDRYLSVLEASEGKMQPLIILLEQNGQSRAMVIGRREKLIIPVRLGYKTLLKPKLNGITVVYGGVLGQPNEQASSLLVRELMKLLKQREADLVYFNHLRVDSSFYREIRRISPFLCRNHIPVIDLHWSMSIPDTIDKFYPRFSKNHRSNLRRGIKKLEQSHNVIIVKSNKEDNVDMIVRTISQISDKTYQSGIGSGFIDNLSTRSRITVASRFGWLKSHILYVDDNPVAFQLGLQYGNTYLLDQIGYDPQWRSNNVGTCLFLKVLETLCHDPTMNFIDFGFGDARYKRSYGDDSWQEVAATYLFAPRIHPVLINFVNSLNSGLTLGLYWFLHKTGVFAWIKRVWRKKLKETAEQSNCDK